MSLLGVKIYVTDSATAFSSLVCPVLFQSELPNNALPKDNIKTILKSAIMDVDIWWCGKPYIKVTIDKEAEKMLSGQFKFKRPGKDKKDITHYLIDICDITKESPSRLMRARDLECSVESAFITEDCFEKAFLVKDIIF